MSQKNVVYNAIKSVINFNDGDKVKPTDDERKTILDTIAKVLHENRETELSEEASAKYSTEEDIRKKYVNGLLNNWLRKDKRLNGNTKYEIKNPGGRATSGDGQIKELMKMKNHPDYQDKLDIIEQAIEKRKQEIMIEKAKTVQIDLSVLPNDLLDKLSMEESEEQSA